MKTLSSGTGVTYPEREDFPRLRGGQMLFLIRHRVIIGHGSLKCSLTRKAVRVLDYHTSSSEAINVAR